MKRIVGLIFWVLWMLIYNIITQVIGLILLILSIFLHKKHLNLLLSMINFWAKLGMYLAFSKVEVRGKENLIDEPAMIIGNHLSNIDVIVYEAYFPLHFVFFSKKEVFHIPIVGSLMKKFGHISVDRSNPKRAAVSLRKAIEEVKKDRRVLIFPEGSRNPYPRELTPFKPGTLLVAREGKVAIIPTLVCGTSELLPVKKKFYMMPHKVILQILPPILPGDELHPSNAKNVGEEDNILENLRIKLTEEYNKLADEMGLP